MTFMNEYSPLNANRVFGYRRMDNLRASWSVAYGSDCIRTDADDPVCSRANVTHNKVSEADINTFVLITLYQWKFENLPMMMH
jgi:hypothetical protein